MQIHSNLFFNYKKTNTNNVIFEGFYIILYFTFAFVQTQSAIPEVVWLSLWIVIIIKENYAGKIVQIRARFLSLTYCIVFKELKFEKKLFPVKK